MRVIHIIPSAFEYFNDIRAQAFTLVDGLCTLGVETEAFTLQYGSTTRSAKEAVRSNAPSVHTYQGSADMRGVIQALEDFDLVHLHCPFLGAGRQLLAWKKNNPTVPLVVTYYRDVAFSDVFSLFIKLYNAYFLPKMFSIADALICDNGYELAQLSGSKYIPAQKQVVCLDEIMLAKEWGKLDKKQAVAAKVVLVYNNLLNHEL